MKYRRLLIPGGTYFFTLATYHRKKIFHIPHHIDLLHESCRRVQTRHPFIILAAVILPDHLHMIWTLPEHDADFSMRWRLIKAGFTIEYAKITGDAQPWQNRYWEHYLGNDQDLERHITYIHYNPVKHGWVEQPEDWKYSSIHHFMQAGSYPEIPDCDEIRGMIGVGDE
jgi:putative transposase